MKKNLNKFLKINPADSVCVAIRDLEKGETVTLDGVPTVIQSDIPAGHKFASKNIPRGQNVIKYGFPIGHATQNIRTGEHVHTFNLATNLDQDPEYTFGGPHPMGIPVESEFVIDGFLRSDGNMGIRNEIWIVPLVGCINGTAKTIADRAKTELDVRHVDDILVLSHIYGCSQLGDDLKNTRLALAALAKHPNAGGVLVIGLGCENNRLDDFKKALGVYDAERIKFLIAQDVEDEINAGLEIVQNLVEKMKCDRRRPLPLSKLKVGLKCGGSDGFSGITANPLTGRFSDWLIARGGTSVLTEVPEMFGSETILMSRCRTKRVFDDTVKLINRYKRYFRRHRQPVYENPSPGNIAGGLTTLEDKSLGCTQKGGAGTVVDVIPYAGPVARNGLNLLDAPGNDPVATGALVMSGCQLLIFTTGRGTPFGSVVPTVKVSTNTDLSRLKPRWIDFDAGSLLAGKPVETALNEFIALIIAVCNGVKLNHEKSGFREIAIFKSGVTL